MSEIDLTDYTDIGARAWFETLQDEVKWEDVPEGLFKFEARDFVLPIVSAVIAAYDKNHKTANFLEGIG